jgi:hypothetical protein
LRPALWDTEIFHLENYGTVLFRNPAIALNVFYLFQWIHTLGCKQAVYPETTYSAIFFHFFEEVIELFGALNIHPIVSVQE